VYVEPAGDHGRAPFAESPAAPTPSRGPEVSSAVSWSSSGFGGWDSFETPKADAGSSTGPAPDPVPSGGVSDIVIEYSSAPVGVCGCRIALLFAFPIV
jgi:hypothetical protein